MTVTRQLTKKACLEGAEDKQVYDLCPYVIVLYGLLSPTNGSPRILDALLRVPTPASLHLSGDQERGNEGEVVGECISHGC